MRRSGHGPASRRISCSTEERYAQNEFHRIRCSGRIRGGGGSTMFRPPYRAVSPREIKRPRPPPIPFPTRPSLRGRLPTMAPGRSSASRSGSCWSLERSNPRVPDSRNLVGSVSACDGRPDRSSGPRRRRGSTFNFDPIHKTIRHGPRRFASIVLAGSILLGHVATAATNAPTEGSLMWRRSRWNAHGCIGSGSPA